MQPVIPASTDATVYFAVHDNTTFLPYSSLSSATPGLALWYKPGATAAVVDLTEADLSAQTDAHSDGKLRHIRDGIYRLDLPDAAIPASEGAVTTYGGTATGYVIFGGALVGKPAEVVSASLVTAIWTAVTDSAGVTTLLSRLSSARAGYLDNLSAGAVALQSSITTLLTNVAAVAAAVWAYATRTLTQGAASVVAAVTGSSVTVYRGTRWTIPLTGLPSNTGYASILFSVKPDDGLDSAAICTVRKNASGTGDGLIYFAGATVVAAQASITVVSATALTIIVEAATTVYASPGSWRYGIKYLDASGYPSQASIGGVLTVVADIPKAIV